MRIAVCSPQVPFSHGGAEVLAETLVQELRARDHDADLVTVPFKWYPRTQVLQNALVWRLLDLEESQGSPIDLVIATKFPSYAVRHPRKVVWLVHQFRQAYDLDRTELGQFGDDSFDRATRRAVHRLDSATLSEARGLFAISANVAARLRQSLGLEAEVLRPPPQRLNYRCESYGDFVLSVGRLDRAKRVDLLLEAAATERAFKVIVVGDGPDRERLEQLAGRLELDGRVTFAGRVGNEALTDFYARCLAVFYAPVDEDFGFVPYEAFLSEKPIVTTRDAGGPLEVVADGENGVVCEPAPAAVATACAFLAANVEQARARGLAGKAIATRLTWDAVVDRILSAA
jgi:glycosyltransferase involved in cell wall biosynthesis